MLAPLAAASPAFASLNDGCNYYGYDCYTPSSTANYTSNNNYPYLGTYTNTSPYSSNSTYTSSSYSFSPQPDPNALANSYAASHQTTSTNGNCNYYGYDCYTPSSTNYSFGTSSTTPYVPMPDPNDIANEYYAKHNTYYGYGLDYGYNSYPYSYWY